ncbi:MAG: ATP-binding protein [Dysgonomonas sp.]
MDNEYDNINEVGFTVDSGLIHRLGTELVGKAETAVSELIKNAYDADATEVNVEFIDSEEINGSLIISDNGVGMTKEQLINGFMRISSSDKIHRPYSDIFGRKKAGQKGIGRFATQRLGQKLTIITQPASREEAYEIIIDWTQYTIDTDLISIKFPINTLPKQESIGTTLRIDNLIDIWEEASIKRIYNYVIDLLQPDFIKPKDEANLSLDAEMLNIIPNTKKDQKFEVVFKQTLGKKTSIIIGDKDDITKKALVTIESYIDHHGKGKILISSKGLKLDDSEKIEIKVGADFLKAVRLKIHYFIYEKSQYYHKSQSVTKKDLSNIKKLANNSPHIKLYRNGFRVLPYGEIGNDWLGLDKRYTGESGYTNIPWGNLNFFGFIQIIDTGGLFEETASREGLIESDALNETILFIQRNLSFARKRISASVYNIRENEKIDTPFNEKVDGLKSKIERQLDQLEKVVSDSEKSVIKELRINIKENFVVFEERNKDTIEEINMMRILAGMGLTIGEFTHEIRNITSSISGILSPLYTKISDDEVRDLIVELETSISNLLKYAQYFERTISKSKKIDIEPINIIDVINSFCSTVKEDVKNQKIKLDFQIINYGLYTIPMHESEWNAIFFNLYTNSKKALKGVKDPQIKIIVGKENDVIYIEFLDNGIGIPEENEERIFDAFFTTSASSSEEIQGSGLGLKIIKDIITSYNGKIFLTDATIGYRTSFRIEVDKANSY